MPSPLSHGTVALALGSLIPTSLLPRKWWLIGAICTFLPDVDVAAFRMGISYQHILGHRGLTHSIFFAVVLALTVTGAALFTAKGRRLAPVLSLYLCACTLSHGMLDAFTNGGYGVAFWAPFSDQRFFFAWRPIDAAPLSVTRFLSSKALVVIGTELMWVVLPCLLIVLFACTVRATMDRSV
jgi:inner membrane protein